MTILALTDQQDQTLDTVTPATKPHTPGYARGAIVGVIALAGAMFVARISSFVAQLALGLLLAKEDFKLWAFACTAHVLVAGLRDGGAGRILIQKGRVDSASCVRAITGFSWLLNVVAFFWLLAAAPVIASIYNSPEVISLVCLIGLSVLTTTPTTIGKARMSLSMRFKEMAVIDGCLSIFTYSLMVALAFCDMGAMSFVIPQAVANVVAALVYRRMAGPTPEGDRLNWTSFKEIFAAGKWLIIAAFAVSLAMNGDYMVIGKFAEHYVADYFFGFQLTLAISILFSQGIQQVMLPTFVKLNDEPARQGEAFKRAVGLAMFAGAPLCVAMSVLSPPMMQILWGQKWVAAIPVVQVMAASMTLRLLIPLAVAMFQSHARWSLYFGVLAFDAIVVVIASYLGTLFGDLLSMVLTIAVLRGFSPPAMACIAAKSVGVPRRALLRDILGYIVPFFVIGGVVLWGSGFVLDNIADPKWHEQWRGFGYMAGLNRMLVTDLGVRLLLLTVGYGLLLAVVFRSQFMEFITLVRTRRG